MKEHWQELGLWTYTYVCMEIRKVVDNGYVILEIYKMLEHKMATYENEVIFTEFTKEFLKMEKEASS